MTQPENQTEESNETTPEATIERKRERQKFNSLRMAWDDWAKGWKDPEARPPFNQWAISVQSAFSRMKGESVAKAANAIAEDLPWLKEAVRRGGWAFQGTPLMFLQLEAVGRMTGPAWESHRVALRLRAAREWVPGSWFDAFVKAGAGFGAKKNKRTFFDCAKNWVEGDQNPWRGGDASAAKTALEKLLALGWTDEERVLSQLRAAIAPFWSNGQKGIPNAAPGAMVAGLEHFGPLLADALTPQALAMIERATTDRNALCFGRTATWHRALEIARAIRDAREISAAIAPLDPQAGKTAQRAPVSAARTAKKPAHRI